jgi:hypothetical protein
VVAAVGIPIVLLRDGNLLLLTSEPHLNDLLRDGSLLLDSSHLHILLSFNLTMIRSLLSLTSVTKVLLRHLSMSLEMIFRSLSHFVNLPSEHINLSSARHITLLETILNHHLDTRTKVRSIILNLDTTHLHIHILNLQDLLRRPAMALLLRGHGEILRDPAVTIPNLLEVVNHQLLTHISLVVRHPPFEKSLRALDRRLILRSRNIKLLTTGSIMISNPFARLRNLLGESEARLLMILLPR